MCTVVLRSQDCLRKPHVSCRIPVNYSIPNNVSRRKRSFARVESSGQDRCRVSNPGPTSLPFPPNRNLVTGQVKILKRGEALPDSMNYSRKPEPTPPSSSTPVPVPVPRTTPSKEIKKFGIGGRCYEDDSVLCSTGRLGPDPQTVQMQIRASDFYAGPSSNFVSPLPSSLPLPAFFRKEKKKNLMVPPTTFSAC